MLLVFFFDWEVRNLSGVSVLSVLQQHLSLMLPRDAVAVLIIARRFLTIGWSMEEHSVNGHSGCRGA